MRDLYQYSVSRDDYVAAAKRAGMRARQRISTRWPVQLAIGAAAAALGFALAMAAEHWDAHDRVHRAMLMAVVAGLGFYLLAVGLFRRGIGRLLARSRLHVGPSQLGLNDDGIWLQGPHGECVTRWSGWESVEEHAGLVLLHHDDFTFAAIPFSAFESADERRRFIEHVRGKIAGQGDMSAGGASLDAPGASPSLEQADTERNAVGVGTLARSALTLVLLRRTPEAAVDASWGHVLLLVLASLAAPTLFALATIGNQGYFAWEYLPGDLFHVPVILFAAILLAFLAGHRDRVKALLIAGLLAWIAIDAITLAAWFALLESLRESRVANELFSKVPMVWFAMAMARFAIGMMPGSGISRRAAVLAGCALFLAVPLSAIDRERSLWSMDYSRQGEEASATRAERMAAASEDSFYRQPQLLSQALEEIKPGRPGVIDVYFIGMAGYGYQDVFMREVDSVARLFRERFGAEGHIVKLINNPKTVLSEPVASATSLRAALKRVGEVMDPDEDVLVLFLTSHGSHDHRFALELWPFRFNQITPEILREALDGSGIKNRVVIVSACYAGGFVKALSNDDTLVIAAAAPDRNSFGCSNENDWTYFGKAYFDEALRKTVSFTQAFEMAKPVIENREREQKFDPSRPQMRVGTAIREKLRLLERQLTPGEMSAGP